MLKGLGRPAHEVARGRYEWPLQPPNMDEKISRVRDPEEKRPGAEPGLEYFAALEHRGRL